MRTQSLLQLFGALHRRQARFLVVGGYAVIAHGYVRATQDLDLVIDLEDADAARDVVEVLADLGYRPRAPVRLEDYADARIRRTWIDDKQAQVFSVIRSAEDHQDEVDLFLEPPFDFAAAWTQALVHELPEGIEVRFVDLGRLRLMKQAADRAQDRADLAALDDLHPEAGR